MSARMCHSGKAKGQGGAAGMRPALVFGCLLLMGPLLAGCWDRHEVETLALATALSIDKAPEPSEVLVNAQFAISARFTGAASGAAAGGGMGPGSGLRSPFGRTTGGPTGPTVWVVGSPGRTLTDAMDGIVRVSPRLPFWAHVRLLVVGEELARAGLDAVLDGLLRDRQIRRTPWLVVARGVPGYRILELPNPLSPAPEEGISRLLEILRGQSASLLPQRLQDFLVAYAQPGVDPFTAGITYATPVPHDPRLAPSTEELPALPKADGTAVFRDDRLAGWLDEEASQGLALLLGESRAFFVTVPCPGRSGSATVRVLRFDSQRSLRLTEAAAALRQQGSAPGQNLPLPEFAVRVLAEGALQEQECRPGLDGPGLSRLQREIARLLARRMQRSLRLLHGAMQADAAGFGLQLYHQHPEVWAQLAGRWRELLPRLPVRVRVEFAIRRQGLATGRAESGP